MSAKADEYDRRLLELKKKIQGHDEDKEIFDETKEKKPHHLVQKIK